MNTITQIENALRAVNQATFQNMINHLLHLRGNRFGGAPGSVVGKDKTSKGAPDSFFLRDDKYIFVESTTKERIGESKSFFEKLSKDIEHCFNEAATSIPKENIAKIILACNEKVTAEEHLQLSQKVKALSTQTQFELLNIQNLPLLIYDCPKLAEEYLNVQIVKGDIYHLGEFLKKTTKGLQPSLTNKFIGREDEIENCLASFNHVDMLLLTGGQGVGKSKLAVTLLEKFATQDYVPIVIQSSGVSLWDDYQHLFSPGKKYVILFDDANKSVSNLSYLLSKLELVESYTVKVIITCRDYVKRQVVATLENTRYEEIEIGDLKDDQIGDIITAALPNLKYHNNIRRSIIDLSKGNARVALMATYSVTPGAETNYLSSPVLLYEKYFKKIAEEIGVFNDPMILKSLAIVSFFGVLDRTNEEIKLTLERNFKINWNELWTAIMELHSSEILNVYESEIVKVSDQVLASYAFYKCFIDPKTAQINYNAWLSSMLEKQSGRIRTSLIDANNTFGYYNVKELVLPHLDALAGQLSRDEDLYTFYDLFWFYKGRDCLLYLNRWIDTLNQEVVPPKLSFSFVHNDHTSPSKHFSLLKSFWEHSNELLQPSLELTLNLLEKQPSRLPEVLKFFLDDFKYKLEDRDSTEVAYRRQMMLIDVLTNDSLKDSRKTIANGFFLAICETLLGWHYHQYGPSKGHQFTIYNFDLYKSEELTVLRERLLLHFYSLFNSDNNQSSKILRKIIYPDGDIDKSIYVDEIPIYQKLLNDKLDVTQYSHCKFIAVLAKHLTEAGKEVPEGWKTFIESDVRKLSHFLKPGWEYREGKTFEEYEIEKKNDFDEFLRDKNWDEIREFLIRINTLYLQQTDTDGWSIQSSVGNVYRAIAEKDIADFMNALRLYFGKVIVIYLNPYTMNGPLSNGQVSADEFWKLIDEYEFEEKRFWQSSLLEMLPENQVKENYLEILIGFFKEAKYGAQISKMLNFLKFAEPFEKYKAKHPELERHNIISYLSSLIIQTKPVSQYPLGFHFISECSGYFTQHPSLLEECYWFQWEKGPNFDHNGDEFKLLVDQDHKFIAKSLKEGKIGVGYSSNPRLKRLNPGLLWEYIEYEELIEEVLLIIFDEATYISMVEDDILSLFTFRKSGDIQVEKAKAFILKLTQKYSGVEKIATILAEVVYQNFNDWFVSYFREYLLINKEFNLTKQVTFGRSESWSGSRVPLIQKKINFYEQILVMLQTLPNVIEYFAHIDYFEQHIIWAKKDIAREQRSDFMEEFN